MARQDGSMTCLRFITSLALIAIVVVVTISVISDKSWIQEIVSSERRLLDMELDVKIRSRGKVENCDLFKGEWVKNPSGAAYTNNTCIFIDSASDCLTNGRPDITYLYWSWKPYNCEPSSSDIAEKFMDSMRNKYWGLIGDSLIQNQLMSLICLLSKVELPTEVTSDMAFKDRTFFFPSHNLTIENIWAPYLVEYNANPNNEKNVYLDALDEKWTNAYHKYDYIVISAGQWYLLNYIAYANGKIIGCHNCVEGYKEIGILDPYRKVLENAFDFIASSDHKPAVFFRTWMPNHVEYEGLICNRTWPYTEGEYNGKLYERLMREVEVETFGEANKTASKNGIRMELLDTYHLSMLRPDGHPGAYRYHHPFDNSKKVEYDCVHSCLPGPVDAWNKLMMMKAMMNAESMNFLAEQKSAV